MTLLLTESGRPVVPTDHEALPSKLELICKACGGKGKYEVGRVYIDPEAMRLAKQDDDWLDKAACFTGYFRCRHCDAGGPWGLSRATQTRLGALALLALHDPSRALVQIARPQLFDGTPCRTATEGEVHLKKLIEAKPADYFLWSRLGNLYVAADLMELAYAAFTKAVELNCHDVESLHSLACYWLEKKESERAAEHFALVLRYCRKVPPRNVPLWHEMVRHTLENLYELHMQSGGRIPFLPPMEPDPALKNEGVRTLVVSRLDMSQEETWERLTRMYLTGKEDDSSRHRVAVPPPGFRAPIKGPGRAERVGRNERCPCGSGKKFKHCCGGVH